MLKCSYVSLTGGLGNQLFQYFFAIAASHALRIPIKIDDSRQEKVTEHSNSRLTHSGLMLDLLEVDNSLGWLERSRRVMDYALHRVLNLGSLSNNRTLNRTMLGTCYEAKDTDPTKLLGSAVFPKAKRYVGYFQSHEYFNSIDQVVKDKFRLKAATIAKGAGVFNEEIPVAIHVRRGDYRNREDLALLGPEYYLRAIKQLGVEGQRGLVLSDEPNAKDVREIARLTGLDIAPEISPPEAVGVLASAKSLVCANSSLSFASGLIGNEGQIGVAAPLVWTSNDWSRKQILNYPEGWFKIG